MTTLSQAAQSYPGSSQRTASASSPWARRASRSGTMSLSRSSPTVDVARTTRALDAIGISLDLGFGTWARDSEP